MIYLNYTLLSKLYINIDFFQYYLIDLKASVKIGIKY